MLAPTILHKKADGLRIAVDAYDICLVAEIENGVQVTYMATNEPDVIVVTEPFEDVLDLFAEAKRKAQPRKPRDGDEWKFGYDDDEGC